jgi:DNA-binding Lrp family transcriptional regulator
MLIDELDRKILDALRKDARISSRKIAQRLGVTAPTIIARIRKLEEVGVITGYSVKVRTEPFHGILYILTGRKARSLRAIMEKMDGVTNVMTTSDGGLIVLIDLEAKRAVDESCKKKGIKCISFKITSQAKHHEIKALCAYCKQAMDDALRLTLGRKRYYVCCPACARELRERYDEMERGARVRG